MVTMTAPSPTSSWFSPAFIWGISLILTFVILVGGGGTFAFLRYYDDQIYPGISIDNVSMTGLERESAVARLQGRINPAPDYQLTLAVDNIAVASSSAELGLEHDYETAVETAFAIGRQGSLWNRLKTIAGTMINTAQLTSPLKFQPAQVEMMVDALKTKVDTPNQEPTATLGTTNNPATITIAKGTIGREVDKKLLMTSILNQANEPAPVVAVPVASVGAELNPDQIADFQTQAKAFVGKKAVFTFKEEQVTLRLNDQDLVKLITYPDVSKPSPQKLDILLDDWEKRVTREPQNAEFVYDPTTLKVTTFKPHRNGLTLDRAKTAEQLGAIVYTIYKDGIASATPETTITKDLNIPAEKKSVFEETLALTTTTPQKTLANTNDLGINELVGFGESEYAHSIPSRVHNVALAASRINYHIVKPGEEFSFNRTLGDVSQATGYQPAYVIRSGQTVLGDGGGVCQVSTTLFRSVLNAGLKVTKRKAHSYRVSYYELDQKPGVDATVYAGDVDLRFINDTGKHILIHTETDSKRLYMKVELYGTSDGRKTEIVDHKTWDYRSAPAPVYIPDPSLPPGRTKQVDWAASGIKASFKNVIKDKDGNLIREDEYYSNYVPWSAKYLRGV